MSKGRRRWASQLENRENLPFLHVFVLFGPSTDWTRPTYPGEGGRVMIFTQSIDSTANLFWKPSQTQLKMTFYRHPGVP